MPVLRSPLQQVLVRDLPLGVAGWGLGVALLGWLHGAFWPGFALLASLIGAVVLRRFLSTTYRSLPPFLALPIDVGIGVFGVSVASLGSFALFSWPYWVLQWQAALPVAVGAISLGLGLATVIYTHSRLALEIEVQEVRLSELRLLAVDAQLKALQAQVNPHFLFNALNTLAELVHEDVEQAEELIGDLAHMMRYALRSSMGIVELAAEIEMVRRYLRLENARWGDRLAVDIEVDETAMDIAIPGLIVQPLVENAILYAVASRKGGGHVRLVVESEADGVRITVSDDGPGMPAEVVERLARDVLAEGVGTGGAGGGLYNVARRLRLAFGAEGPMLHISTTDDGGARLTMRVPRQ